MFDLYFSKASRRVAAELGNLTDHQQNIFTWVSEKRGWKPGSVWGNYSTPSGTLRDVKAVAKKGHLVLDERGYYVVADSAKARIDELAAELRAEDKAKDAARQAAYDARRYVVVRINLFDGSSLTVSKIYTGRDGDTQAHNRRRHLVDEGEGGQYKYLVVELAN